MKRLDRYLIISFIGPFFAILLIVVFILMMQFLWVYIDELVGKGLSFSVILEFMMWGGTTMLPLSLPLATLLAGVMTIGQLSENTELTAMKSAGISLARVMAPLVVVCILIVCVGAFLAANYLVPVAYNKIYSLRSDITNTNKEINIPEGAFYDGIEGYTLRIGSRNKKTGMMYDVMVYDHTGGKANVSESLADSAIMTLSKSKDYLVFRLYNGINYQEDNNITRSDTTISLQRLQFAVQEMIIPLNNYAFEKSDGDKFGNQVNSKRLSQLRVDRDSLSEHKASIIVGQKSNFIEDRSLRYAYQLDTSFHKANYNMDLGESTRWKSRADEKRAYESARTQARSKISSLKNAGSGVYNDNWILRRTVVNIFKKYAGALACLIMFLIGAPLGAFVNRKTGLGASAIVAVLFFVVYWVVDISGVKMARDGVMTGFAGAFVSSAVLLPIGLYLSWKATHDSSIFKTDFPSMWRKIKVTIMGFFKKTKIVYFGTPEFAVAPLDALVRSKYKVVAVVTVADKPVGRGQQVSESAVKKYAVEHDIPVLQPLKLKDPDFLRQLASYKADLFVVVAFRMLPEAVWSMPPMGTFNLHAALLPQYRGAAPINWTLINGERMTGVTTFMIDQSIDTGKIILRHECPVEETDTAGTLHDRLMPMGADMVMTTVQGLLEKSVETRVQRSFIQGSEVLKPAPKLTRELCHIDWDAPTVQVYNLIRGLSPYPAAYTNLIAPDGTSQQLKVFFGEKLYDLPSGGAESATDGTAPARPAPGTVLSDGKTYLAIATSDGAISITDLQLAGKKRMAVRAFLAGFRNPESYKADKGTSAAEIDRVRSANA